MIARLASALLLAFPAFLLVNETFHPIDEHVALPDPALAHVFQFELDRPEPLYVEYGVTLRAENAGARPVAVLAVNDTIVARVTGARLFVSEGGRTLAPMAATRAGNNRLRVSVEGAAEATVSMNGRIQNYYGIAPDFPRMVVVADAAVTAAWVQQSWGRLGARLLGCLLAAGLITTVAARGARGPWRWALMTSPSWMLWVILAGSLLTPLHVWLSVEAAFVAAGLGWGLALAGRAVARRRGLVGRVALVVLLNACALELALRVFNAVHPSFVFYATGYERYRGRPGAPFYGTRLNAGGFNDIDHPRDRLPGTARRIVAIGDSFVLGVVPYRDNFLTRLEGALAPAGHVEVINIGIPATEPADYLAMLVHEGLAYRPDTVLVHVFIGNDFEAPGARWYDHSFTVTFLRALWRLRSGTPPAPAASGGLATYQDDQPSLSRDRFLEIEVDRSWVYDAGEAALAPAVARVAGALETMRDVARRAGADLAVVLIPDEVQVDAALADQVTRASNRAPAGLDFDRPNRLLTVALEAEGIPVLDLLPVFRAAASRERLYKPQDTHWNIAGNRLAASAIAAFLDGPRAGTPPPN